MILAAAVMLFQMQGLPPKSGAAVAQQEAVTYAENIPAPALFSPFSPNLPDNDGTKKTPKPVLPDANTQILSGVYVLRTAATSSRQTLRRREAWRRQAALPGHRAIERGDIQPSAPAFEDWTTTSRGGARGQAGR